MKTYQEIQLRAFDVRIRDERTGEEMEDTIVFTKTQLQAAQVVGQSSKELIYRAYNRAGFTVLDVGKAHKAEARLDLEGLYREADPEQGAPLDPMDPAQRALIHNGR